MTNFGAQSLKAAAWSTGGQIAKTAIQFVVFAILARPLSPADYGLLGMVLVIVNFARVFTDSGFNLALVQGQSLGPVHFSSVFWLNMTLGLVLTVAFLLGAPWIAAFYDRPELTPVAQVLSFSFLLFGMNLVQSSVLVKELRFRKLMLIELAASAVAGVTAIVMAWSGCGVWSIVAQSMIVAALTSALLWFSSQWRPSFVFSWSAIRDLVRFSVNLLGTNILNYWVRNLDYLLIGKYLGAVPLGFYNRAYSVMMLPITNLSQAISRALFPSLSKIQDDPARVRRVYLKVTRVIGFIAYPGILGLIAVAPHFVETVLGEKWLPMTTVMRILCVVSLIQSTSSLTGNLYLSQGRTDLQFRVTFWLRLNLIAGIVAGLYWGIEGVATGYLIAVVINQFPNLYFAGRLVGLRFGEYVRANAANLACAGTMALLVFGLACLLDGRTPVWVALVLEVAAGVLIWLAMATRLPSAGETFSAIRQVVPGLPAHWFGGRARAAP